MSFCADTFHSEMGSLLLGEHFADCSPEDDGVATFKRGMGIVGPLLHGWDSEQYLFPALTELLTSQWTDPVLNKIMNGETVERDVGS